jgi:DNA-directed RNA polymerase subunit omega
MVATITPFPAASVGQRFVGAPRSQSMKADLVEKASLVIQDPPLLINAVSKRVRQLNQGRPPLVERKPGMREADIALTEIIEGKIKIVRDEVIEVGPVV